MDRSLKWRTIILVAITLFCVATLAPSFTPKDTLPSWFTSLFSKRINYGLDLQGGLHIVYSIDLNKAVADRASEIKRDLDAEIDSRQAELKDVTVREAFGRDAQGNDLPVGSIVVTAPDAAKRALIEKYVKDTVMDQTKVTFRECGATSVCFNVSTEFAETIKKSALTNAVSTIRDRINEKGLAEPSVVEKGDQIIVELPGLDEDQLHEMESIIERTAKLDFKVVDDISGYTEDKKAQHGGTPFMRDLYVFVAGGKGADTTEYPPDPEAKKLGSGISATPETWVPEDSSETHQDFYLFAYDAHDAVPIDWAKKHGCWREDLPVDNGKVDCNLTGRQWIERYLFGDKMLGYKGLGERDPRFKVPDDHQIGYELIEPPPQAKNNKPHWRTYYLNRTVELTGSAISNAYGSYDQNTNRPIVLLDFNRAGGKKFGDLTARISGMKLATILDNTVKSAPIINGAIVGGRASIHMGGGDTQTQEKERDDLVAVLKTGSLPAPLEKMTSDHVGATLGRDAIDKTKMSFAIGIGLVILIMVGIYKWSGMIAVFAVVFHILMTLAVMAIFGATLTLPGIAAVVLSIGMEVDGNILIYERIRDELLLGKSVRGAIDLGFSRAFSAILDGQLTTAAAGWVLLQYGSGPIKGFAVMLLVGVFTTLTTNIWVTRILFDWAVARKKGQLQTFSI
jgi:preprotein translocase subunit SecD